MHIKQIPADILSAIRKGSVIPAHPLALTPDRKLDVPHQRALTRYYIDAGSGGIAVGVHSTQFEIRDPNVGLFEPVLRLASETIDEWCKARGKAVLKIAGVCGKTEQAVREAGFARETGFHACLVSLGALATESLPGLVRHCRQVAAVMPVIGFYLQPSVGGRLLPYQFWREFAEIDNVLAIKIAPFNRYQTLDVVRAVCEVGREAEITLYTGNDDNILVDLLTEYRIQTPKAEKKLRIVGGLLGHWAVWTRKAVEQLEEIRALTSCNALIPPSTLTLAAEITDANAAFFDAANRFAGCIPGIHQVLQRQGLMQGTWCLNPAETLSPGQAEEIDRVYASYRHLNDDDFVRAHLKEWIEA
ncbi:MAG: dihydrodipicolinate synthase family protein [Acidobacteria bacterium]|nr:MAG: dihydrodipicolinate synthase family protein [Acidobacteriota bacterium]